MFQLSIHPRDHSAILVSQEVQVNHSAKVGPDASLVHLLLTDLFLQHHDWDKG
jgi:hypothetical protein